MLVNKISRFWISLLLLAMVMCPVSGMIKDSVYLGADSVIFNTSTFFISQPESMDYFQSPYEADIRESDGFYYPVVLSFNKYAADTNKNGTLNVVVTIFYANLTNEDVIDENITYESGANYLDTDNNIAVAWIMPLDSTAYISLNRIEGNFTIIKRNAWYKTTTVLNKPNLDALSNALVDIINWYLDLLKNVITPVLNLLLLLWEYIFKWVICIEAVVFVIKRAVILGSSFTIKTDGGR